MEAGMLNSKHFKFDTLNISYSSTIGNAKTKSHELFDEWKSKSYIFR